MRTGVLPESKSQQPSPSLPPSCYRAVCVRLYLTDEAPLRREKATQRAVRRWWQVSLACVNQGGATQLFFGPRKTHPSLLPVLPPVLPPYLHLNSESGQTVPTLTFSLLTSIHTCTQPFTFPSLPTSLPTSTFVCVCTDNALLAFSHSRRTRARARLS